MKTTIYIISVLAIMIMVSCGDKLLFGERFYRITFYNEANYPVYFYEAALHSNSQYPDTVPVDKKNFVKVKANGKFYIDNRKPWEENFKKLRQDTLSVYVIDAAIFETKSWEQIRTDYDILKRYDLSIHDLQSLDFNVYFPARPAMQDVKMWSKYMP